ncbi:MAG: NADPH-dependent F420 reductase [Kofleriaceae bacterium]|nr:MAG: NADPH-dependent F420 reductase [Kofleriaceae bacterium]
MRIGLLGGTGKEGRGLALRWARAGHELVIGSRDPAKGDNVRAADADVVVVCVPYPGQAETLRELAPRLEGKVVIDLVVPLVPPQVTRVVLPPGGAAALEAQALLPGARVVGALHHVSSVHLGDPEHVMRGDVLVCGDDAAAKETAIALVADLGMRGLDAGPLANAVALEAMTPVLLYMNRRYKKPGLGLTIAGLEE